MLFIETLQQAPCGTTPQVKSFSIMLYVDPYLSKPVQVWQMYIHALQKLDVSTVQGHGTRFSLVLKYAISMHMNVKMYKQIFLEEVKRVELFVAFHLLLKN